MNRIPDKSGNALLIDKKDDHLYVQLEMPTHTLNLGSIYPSEKTFIVELGQLSVQEQIVPLSAKFMVEVKTFDKVVIGGKNISLNSLLYLLGLPNGSQIESFTELVYIDSDFFFIQFKSKYEAMLYMCDIYEKYFNEHDPYPAKVGNIEITDADKFIAVSLAFIRNLALLKKGGDPYFLQLTKYYNYVRANPNNDDQ